MKYKEEHLLAPHRMAEATEIGAKLARLRRARKIRQFDAAARAGLARSTAVLIEKGDPSRTIAQILRYLEAIAPGLPLLALLQESDPSLKALEQRETTQRVRPMSGTELQKLDF
jgi:transcriptional regulator with XRE-family HTH domain